MDTQLITDTKLLIEKYGFDVVMNSIETEMIKHHFVEEYQVFLKILVASYTNDAKQQTVQIESPFELSPESIRAIKSLLHADESNHEFTINKTLLGGFVATHNYQKIDASLQGALKRLEV